MCSPSAFVFGCGGFGDVDGLLQSSAQVDGALLDHLPDVLDPVLFVLDAGSLRQNTSAGVRRKTFAGSGAKIRAATPERLTQNTASNPT